MKLNNEQIELAKVIIPGFNPEEGKEYTADDIKAVASEKLIAADLHQSEINKIIGRERGTVETVLRRALGDAAKDKKYEDLIKSVETEITESKTRLTELEKLKGAADPEKVKAIEEKYKSELEQLRKLNTEQADILKQREVELETTKAGVQTEIERIMTNQIVDKLYDSANWVDTADKYVKTGIWEAEIKGRYQFRKEADKVLVFDKEGNIVKDGTVQMTAERLFELKLKEAGKFKQNGAVTSKATTIKPTGNATADARQLEYMKKLQENAARRPK